jgi:hypothetical protein
MNVPLPARITPGQRAKAVNVCIFTGPEIAHLVIDSTALKVLSRMDRHKHG